MRACRRSAVAFIFCVLFAFACDQHHHEGAHVHGQATLSLALEANGELFGELRAPGADIYGFEHEPGDEAQRAARENARKRLSRVDEWLPLPADSGCAWNVAPPADDTHGHHLEVVIAFDTRCAALGPGGDLTVNLAGSFSALKEIRVLISGETQRVVSLEGGAGRVKL